MRPSTAESNPETIPSMHAISRTGPLLLRFAAGAGALCAAWNETAAGWAAAAGVEEPVMAAEAGAAGTADDGAAADKGAAAGMGAAAGAAGGAARGALHRIQNLLAALFGVPQLGQFF